MFKRRLLTVALAFVMLAAVCANAFSFVAFAADETDNLQSCVAMTIGSDENERNFTWYFNSSNGYLDIAERDGDSFPAEYTTYEAVSAYSAVRQCYYHRVSVTGLKPDTQYVYRLVNDNVVSQNYYFETDPVDDFNFIFFGDPQIGGSTVPKNDGAKWNNTVNVMNEMFPETSLVVLAGDQVEHYNSETQYNYFFAPELLASFALARSVGNHESEYKSDPDYINSNAIHNEHFFDPNTTVNGRNYGKTSAGCDYWYSYNNVLFMHINSNNRTMNEHKEFMTAAIEANPNATWKVVVMHYALYGSHYFAHEQIVEMRKNFNELYQEMDIDVVLNGHEHSYVRSYLIEGDEAVITNPSEKSVTDPGGILYITAPSSSGSKQYSFIEDSLTPHIAFKQNNIAGFINVEVDKDSLKLTTYRVDNKAVVDSFEIIKTETKTNPTGNNVALGKEYTTSELNKKNGVDKYPDETGKTMTDGLVAPHDAAYSHEAYIGFNKNDNDYKNNGYASITVDLGKNYELDRFVSRVASGYNSAAGVYAPGSMAIYISDDNSSWEKAGEVDVTDRTDISCMSVAVALDKAVSARYVQYRYTITNGGWAMIAEVKAFEAHEHENGDRCTECGKTLKAVEAETVPAIDQSNLAFGKPYVSTTPNRNDEFDDDGTKLTNGRKGYPNGTKNVYAGWNEDTDKVEITVDLEKELFSDSYTLYMIGGKSNVALPKELAVEIYSSLKPDSDFELVAKASEGGTELILGTGKNDESWSTYKITASADEAIVGRYIKFVIKNAGEGEIRLDEIEIRHNTAHGNLLVGKDYILSGCGTRKDNYDANLTDGEAYNGAMDGDSNRKHNWFGFYHDPNQPVSKVNAPNGIGYFIVDLKEECMITKIRANLTNKPSWGVPAPKTVSVYLSDDGKNWGEPVGNLPIKTIDDTPYWTEITGIWQTRYIKVEFHLAGTFAFVNEIEACGVPVNQPQFKKGDVNMNGEIDAFDYAMIKRAYLGTTTLTDEQFKLADINDNGKLDVTEYGMVKRHYLRTFDLYK